MVERIQLGKAFHKGEKQRYLNSDIQSMYFTHTQTRAKSDLTDKMKRSFFQAAVTSILLYGCTTWTLTKRLEKKLDGNYTRMLRAIRNKSWQQHPTRHQLYGHRPPITKTIQVRRTRHAGHCWRSRDELIRDVLLLIPTHGRAKAGRPARTYIQQLCEDTGCCPEDLPRAMNDREEWRERVRDIRATSTIWWWFYPYILSIYFLILIRESYLLVKAQLLIRSKVASNLTLEMNFQLRKDENFTWLILMSPVGVALAQSCISI